MDNRPRTDKKLRFRFQYPDALLTPKIEAYKYT